MSQGAATLLEYLEEGDGGKARQEANFAMEFVRGIADKHKRAALEAELTEEGWSWRNVQIHIHRMVDEAERRKKSKRSME